MSPRRQDAAAGSNKRGNTNGNELRPTALVFPDASGSPCVNRGTKGNRDLKIDVRAVEEEARGDCGGMIGDASSDCSAMNVFAEAETPLAGAGRAAVAAATAAAAVAGVSAAEAEEVTEASMRVGAGGMDDEVANIATEVVVRQIGLKCSTPIYDREKNLLGNVEGSRNGQRQAAAPSRDNSGGMAGEADLLLLCSYDFVVY